MKRPGSAADPRWYKDAIIYELHVKAFFDGNNDGIGDFAGLMQKLDYIQDLGVTCIWLLPFFPSPLRDDGYDIADYLSVHPSYGTVDDFKAFLDAAHERGLQVMIELVVNHTSDHHPWFQRARQAPAGSPERDFYVWSDTDRKYPDVRIIFTDTETSNWTWDPVAKAYFWHRFFSHQPDLNFDNPLVVEEVTNAMRWWLDMGVDGLRLDAIPYLVERDGTNCENLPETHAVIRRIRQAMDEGYAGRVILAEANQWPTDVRPYFGEGDECHMAFHFPLMPRIFMALRLEDRLPVTDIMAQTPAIPESCQWGLFLRNHDELTLEMVSDEERDYMYLAYSADPRMRINIGIRRRLSPLMDNSRRRVELLNSLLFSFPGTPILYYGDELGMGDNIYLGDRDGVRTPMQWSADRNAGFSRATPARLYGPVIMDPVYGYEAVNVEAQQSDSSSLLNWMRNMIALRKLFRVFGRGSLEFLHPANRKILAYLRRDEEQCVLCVANLSRFAQPVELDLAALAGMRPVEMLGYVEFPPIGPGPYPLTLGPYGFLWFEVQPAPETVEAIPSETVIAIAGAWEDLLEGAGRASLESRVLPAFLPSQRWFGGKSRAIVSASVADWAQIDEHLALAIIDVTYTDDGRESYCLPLAMAFGDRADPPPGSVMCRLESPRGTGVLVDGMQDGDACSALLNCIEAEARIPARHGEVRGERGPGFPGARGSADAPLPVARMAVEQSNSSARYGTRLILKLFRRQDFGINPECEIGRYLSGELTFEHVPPYAGAIEYAVPGQEPATLAILQGLVKNQGDGWTWTLEELRRYFEDCAALGAPDAGGVEGAFTRAESDPSPLAVDRIGIYLEMAATLGRRTAEMHVALGAGVGAFSSEPLTPGDLEELSRRLRDHAASVFTALKSSLPGLPDEAAEEAVAVLSRRRQILDRLGAFNRTDVEAARIRIHGDYHLGQVLWTRNDYVVLDFEGEPARSLAERREKHSSLKDVAGMLRSYSYAAAVGLANHLSRRAGDRERLEPWAAFWEREVSAAFLRGYRESAAGTALLPDDPAACRALLDAYLLDKALYELSYELNNRPAWARIPLAGILALSR
jgi:maltose alpha-D-glucosyltransferase/alpha-amylase